MTLNKFHAAAQEAPEPLWLRLALEGISGSGKTYTALKIAQAMVDNAGDLIAVIDSERGSSRRYLKPRGPFEFAPVDIDGDYHPRNYIDLIKEASDAKAKVLIIDSLSHAWEGDGGMLDLVSRLGGQQRHWAQVRPFERQLFDAILSYPGHVIATMRVRDAWEDQVDDKGRAKKVKVGVEAIQRKGSDYEFDVVMRLQNARATIEKTRCPGLADKAFDRPGENVAKILKPWLLGGIKKPASKVAETPPAAAETKPSITPEAEFEAAAEAKPQHSERIYPSAPSLTGIADLVNQGADPVLDKVLQLLLGEVTSRLGNQDEAVKFFAEQGLKKGEPKTKEKVLKAIEALAKVQPVKA